MAKACIDSRPRRHQSNTMGNTNSRSRHYSSQRRHHSRPRGYHGSGMGSCFEDPSYDDRYDRRRVSPHFSFSFSRPQADLITISQVPAQTRGLLSKATIGTACLRATAPGVSVQEAALLLIEACDMSRFCISFRLAHIHSPLHNTGRSN